jgi:hypothetical protein
MAAAIVNASLIGLAMSNRIPMPLEPALDEDV